MPLPASLVPATMQKALDPAFPNGMKHAGQYHLIFRIRPKDGGDILKQHSLVLMPQRFSQTTEARTALYYTKGEVVADTPTPSGVGMTFFHIVGHTGYGGVRMEGQTGSIPHADTRLLGPTTPDVFAETVQAVTTSFLTGQRLPLRGSLVDGAAALKDLQDTIITYFYPPDQPQTRSFTYTSQLQLEFLNVTAPVSAEDPTGRLGWIIHPHRNLVDIQQDAAKPFLYSYSLQFAALRPLPQAVRDPFPTELAQPRTGLQTTLTRLSQAVTDLTNGINTIEDALTQLVNDQVTGPVSTFIQETAKLGDAVGHFMDGAADKIEFPLYAQRTFAKVLDAPTHSVTTLAEASKQLGLFLIEASDPRSISKLFAGTGLTDGVDDRLTLQLNGEAPCTLALGTQTTGAGIAAAIQTQVRALPPQHASNAAAYRDFTAIYADGQYVLASGTKGSDAGRVTVVTSADSALTPTDASVVLGLGAAHGGQERAGSAYANPALALLRGVEQACTHLQGFPDFFAHQLDAQDAQLAALLPPGVTRPQIRGDQILHQTRITPGDTLQGIGNRVGVDWQTLALVNRLTYPYIVDAPTVLVRGRVSSADFWQVTDTTQTWALDAYLGQLVQIVSGTGAGQTRRIVRNTMTTLILETAWTVRPTDTSNYVIISALNPIVWTGNVTSTTATTLTDATLDLVAESQRGLTLLVTSGPVAGERRRIASNTDDTYRVDPAWAVAPPPGSLYAILGPGPATLRQKIVGDLLAVPYPSAQALLPLRSRVQDVSDISGVRPSTEAQLFGVDALLEDGNLVYDPALADLRTLVGLGNLRQALIHLVNLPIGELEYRPGLGSYVAEEIGLVASLPLASQLLSSVERTVRQDHRIAAMAGAQLMSLGGTVLMSFSAVAINGATVDRISIR